MLHAIIHHLRHETALLWFHFIDAKHKHAKGETFLPTQIWNESPGVLAGSESVMPRHVSQMHFRTHNVIKLLLKKISLSVIVGR